MPGRRRPVVVQRARTGKLKKGAYRVHFRAKPAASHTAVACAAEWPAAAA